MPLLIHIPMGKVWDKMPIFLLVTYGAARLRCEIKMKIIGYKWVVKLANENMENSSMSLESEIIKHIELLIGSIGVIIALFFGLFLLITRNQRAKANHF